MPKRRDKLPKYGLHKSTGQARVIMNHRCFYLGRYGTEESWREYERIVQEWRSACFAHHKTTTRQSKYAGQADLTIVELIAAYWPHVRSYYVKNGNPTTEQRNVQQALRPLESLYAQTKATDFGPLALKAVREKMIAVGHSRKYINDNVSRIKLMFKWAVANELIPPHVYQGIATVVGLRQGRTAARENEPIKPVPDQSVYAIQKYVSRQVWAMIELQRLTGMRPGEAVIMRSCDIDMTDILWEYRPSSHKAEHHGRERIIPLGSRSQKIIKEFMKADSSAFLFSPVDAEAERRVLVHANRKTPLSCGNRPGTNRSLCPKRKPLGRYTVDSYRRAVDRACIQAFSPPADLSEDQIKQWHKSHRWHPHQLRHSAGTRIRKEMGLEAAQVYLGHSKADVTQIYAERNLELARQIAAKYG